MTRRASNNLTYISYFSLGVIISLGEIVAPSIANAQANINNDSVAQIDLFQAIVLGFVQGMTEFIPISSTAHLKLCRFFSVGAILELLSRRLFN